AIYVPKLVATTSYDTFKDSNGVESIAVSTKKFEVDFIIQREKGYSLYFCLMAGNAYQAYVSTSKLYIRLFYKLV
ncbi:MAG: hypothetical protein ACPLX7_10475, partial [Candidatus Kapaibacteriota bacterium]